MKSKTTLLLFFVLVWSPSWVLGQKGYQDGYIITNGGDTLTGLVKDRKPPPFGKIYKKIYFKKPKSGRKKYGPNQIKGYRMGSTEFESLWLEDSYEFFQQKYTSIPNRGEQQFLKVIVRGYLSYYQLEYMDSESDNIDVVPLFKRSDESSLVRVTQGIFGLKKKKLSAYFQDCPRLVDKIVAGEIKDPVEIAYYYNHFKEN